MKLVKCEKNNLVSDVGRKTFNLLKKLRNERSEHGPNSPSLPGNILKGRTKKSKKRSLTTIFLIGIIPEKIDDKIFRKMPLEVVKIRPLCIYCHFQTIIPQ